MHNFEAVIVHIFERPVPNEDWIERRTEEVCSMRFSARGDATANKTVSEFLASVPERQYSHTWRVFRVLNGVREAKDVRELEIERAKRFAPRWR
jgi:hypothetical protein